MLVRFPSLWQITWENHLKEEIVCFAHSFRDFSPCSVGFIISRHAVSIWWAKAGKQREKYWGQDTASRAHPHYCLQIDPTFLIFHNNPLHYECIYQCINPSVRLQHSLSKCSRADHYWSLLPWGQSLQHTRFRDISDQNHNKCPENYGIFPC